MNVLWLLLRVTLGMAATYFVVALALIFWPVSIFEHAPKMSAEAFRTGQIASGTDYDQPNAFAEQWFTMRDGTKLYARTYDASSHTTILLLHGVASDSFVFNRPAGLMREASGARIITIDLRGHGKSQGRPWSVDYIGQYEDDVADVVATLRKDDPQGKIVLAGHSMGGGIALRYALKPSAPSVDAYLLIAPLLGNNAGTMPGARASSPNAAVPAPNAFVYFRVPRFFGVLALNLTGITALNQLPILYFNRPDAAPAYGFGTLSSMQPNTPKDYRAAFGAIHVPLLLIAGEKDEAFNARAYKEIVARYSQGTAFIAPGENHSSILHSPAAMEALKDWAVASHLQ